MTPDQIGAWLKKPCFQIDPDDAKQRLETGVASRKVVADPNPDGTGDICGLNLPPQPVTAIMRKVHRIARHL